MICFGTSIGIAIRGDDLEIVCARGRWNRAAVTGFLRIENFLSRPQAEVADAYRRFRKENHAPTTSATVALPRGAGLIRILDLPAEVEPNLSQAVAYQADLLHPFEEGSMLWDWALLPGSRAGSFEQASEKRAPEAAPGLTVAVALAEKQAVEKLAEWFSAAGIDVACFTFAAGAMYRALRPAAVSSHDGAQALVLLDAHDQTVEMLGIASDGRFCSREVSASAPLEREVALCAAELRIPEGSFVLAFSGRFDLPTEPQPEASRAFCGLREGAVPVAERAGTPADPGQARTPALQARLEELLGARSPEIRPHHGDAGAFRLADVFAAYAAALPGLELEMPGLGSHRGLKWNLLPREKRVYRSHWAYTAAVILAVLVLLLAATRITAGWVEDRYYSSWLDSQIGALAPRVQYLDGLDSKQKNLLAKIDTLEREQRNAGRALGAWREMTRLLPNTVCLQSMRITDNQVVVTGQAESASGLLQIIGQSAWFEQPEFTSAAAKNSEGHESFQIRMRLRETPLLSVPLGTVAAQPAPVPAAAGVPPANGAPPANGGKGGK